MTEPSGQNHYQVLGLERGADERAIKKAYFTLIRKTPPDTHPEEFKRLREAYEVLTDPVARQRFDDAERDYREYGDDASVILREAETAVKEGDEAAAQAKLSALVEERPELRVARENLAASLSRTKDFAGALAHFDTLLELDPEEARYHFFRGLVLRGLEQPKKALAALRRAHRRAPEDLAMELALADLLADQEELDEALTVLDAAASRQKAGSPGALRVALRRIGFLVVHGDREDAEGAITALIEEVGRGDDAELKRHVSSQLAAVAAGCFARKKPGEGNTILRRCEDLYPESVADHPFPAGAEIPFAELPGPGQEWLRGVKPGGMTVARSLWGSSAVGFVVSLGFLVAALYLYFYRPTPWDVTSIVLIAVPIAAGVLGISLCGRELRRLVGAPLGAFLTLHPFYLVDVRGDRVLVYPLIGLGNVQAVHHHTNGGYTHTAVTLSFERHAVSVSLSGKQYAEDWVGAVLGARNRMLQLMLEGFLEAEQGVELIPPALLTKRGATEAGAWRLADRRWYAATALAALALWGLVTPLHQHAAAEEAWGAAVRAGTVEALAPHASSGPHAAEARREIARLHERAQVLLRAAQDARAPGAETLRGALAALEQQGTPRVPVSLALGGRFDADLSKRFAGDLGQVLAAAGLAPVMALVAETGGHDGGDPQTPGPVSLSVTAEATAAGLACAARLDQPGAAPFTWSTAVASPRMLAGTSKPPLQALSTCAWELAGALGLDGAARVVRLRAPRPSSSPYDGEKP